MTHRTDSYGTVAACGSGAVWLWAHFAQINDGLQFAAGLLTTAAALFSLLYHFRKWRQR